MANFSVQKKMLPALSDGQLKCAKEVSKLTALSKGASVNALMRLWRGLVLRTKLPIFEAERVFKGRGVSRNTRPYNLYGFRPAEGLTEIGGFEFVGYDEAYLDVPGGLTVPASYHY